MAESRVLFPLRANAAELAGAGDVDSFLRRLKVASLVYDRILLQSGSWSVRAGPTVATSNWHRTIGRREVEWQTEDEKRAWEEVGFRFEVETRIQDGRREQRKVATPWTRIGLPQDEYVARYGEWVSHASSGDFVGPCDFYWFATFEPLRQQVNAEADWVDFVELPQRSIRGDVVVEDTVETLFEGDSEEAKGLVSTAIMFTNVDLAAEEAEAFNASVSLDPTHLVAARALFGKNDVQVAKSEAVVPILLPNVASLTWRDLAELRQHPELASFRLAMADIANSVETEEAGDLSEAIHAEYESRLRRAFSEAMPTVRGRLASSAIGFVIGESIGSAVSLAMGMPVPVVGGLLGSSAGLAIDRARSRKKGLRWVLVDLDIRDRTKDP